VNCPFCAIPEQSILVQNEHFFAISDRFPVSKGHALIISKRHIENYFELSGAEAAALHELSLKLKDLLQERHHPDAFNLGMNCGQIAGQSVFHFHMHVIPRYSGDKKKAIRGLKEYIREII